MEEPARDAIQKPTPSVGRFLGILSVFVLLGPPVGGMVAALFLSLAAAGSEFAVNGWPGRGQMFFGALALMIVFGLPLSYLLGGGSALVLGVATAIWDAFKGRISGKMVVAGAVILGGIAALGLGDAGTGTESQKVFQLAFLSAHLAAGGTCWLVARSIFKRYPLRGSPIGEAARQPEQSPPTQPSP